MKRGKAYAWLPLWREKWLWGSTRQELEPAERSVFIDLMLLACGDDGLVQANDEIGYPPDRLAGMLICDEATIKSTISKCVRYGKIERLDNHRLRIINWDEYRLSIAYKKAVMAEASDERIQNRIADNTVVSTSIDYKSKSKSKSKSKDKEPRPVKTAPSPSAFDMRMVDLLIGLMTYNNPTTKVARMTVPQRARWADDFRRMRETDKYQEVDIEAVVRFSQTDSFWKTNILSPVGIRKRFEQLNLKAIEAKSRGASKPGLYPAPVDAGSAARAWAERKKRGEQ